MPRVTYALCRLIRQYVTVVLSGDGGDEGFGGYNFYWWIDAILRWQALPNTVQRATVVALDLLTRAGMAPGRLATRARDLSQGDDTSIVQYLFSQVRENEHQRFCRDTGLLPVRRLFEPQWEYYLPRRASRLERLSAHATEVNIRMKLANDYLVKVDIASMKESLEVRVPMLDEDLFAFGLSLPHTLKVKGRTCKRVLREVGRRELPPEVANKPKHGFEIPLDTWTDEDFKMRLREALLGPSSRLPEFFHPEAYKSMVIAFCTGRSYPALSRVSLGLRVIMLLSVQLALSSSRR